jgi:hypothetical protein
MNHPTVVGVQFQGGGKYGDFGWMIKQPQYKDDLFIFNDNVEDFEKKSRHAGDGNAIIRPYGFSNPPMAKGIPTGYLLTRSGPHYRGFKYLDDTVKSIIDRSVNDIEQIVKKRKVRNIYYSAKKDSTLGTGIFQVAPDVLTYITEKILFLQNIEYGDDKPSMLMMVRDVSKQTLIVPEVTKMERRHQIIELILEDNFLDGSVGVCGNIRDHMSVLKQMGGSEPNYKFKISYNYNINILMSGYYFNEDSYHQIYNYIMTKDRGDAAIVEYGIKEGKRWYGLFGNYFAYRRTLSEMGSLFRDRLVFKGPGTVTTPIVYFHGSKRQEIQRYIDKINGRLESMSDEKLQQIYNDGIEIYEPERQHVSKKKSKWYKEDERLGIQNYSDRSLAVFGDTYNYKDELLAIEGIYNKNLKRSFLDDKGNTVYQVSPGYIFASKNYSNVVALVNDINSRPS